MEGQERAHRVGSLFVTESLDFACFLIHQGLKKTLDSPRPTRNRYGATKNRHEWCFEDENQRGEGLLRKFQESDIKAILVIRVDEMRELRTRREG